MDTQTHHFIWQGIEIEATYAPLKYNVVAHLELTSIDPPRAPLPVSETGYRSHFHQPGSIEASGGDVVAYAMAWLNAEADKLPWRRYTESTRQGELF